MPEEEMLRPFRSRFAVLAVAVASLLAACEAAPPPRPVFPEIRFTDEPPLNLDVSQIDIEERFRPTFQEPNVEHLFPVTPAQAAGNWARDRLQATNPGAPRRVRFTIIDASVRETELPRTQGLRGAFTKDQAERYDASAEVQVDIMGPRGFAERTVSAKASRSQTVPEGITPNQREQTWYDLTRALMADLDRQLEQEIRANFNYYVQ
jgi:hypothetical protein